MNKKNILMVAISALVTSNAVADNVAYGTLSAIKVFDSQDSSVTKLYFSDDAVAKNLADCKGVADIVHADHTEQALDQMMSLALAAYMGEKKIRAFSSLDSCEIDMLALQESNF